MSATQSMPQETKIAIGDILVTMSAPYGAVEVTLDMHRNGHDVPANDPRFILATKIAQALKAAVPAELLNKQAFPKMETLEIDPKESDTDGKKPEAQLRVAMENGEPVMVNKPVEPRIRCHKGSMEILFITTAIEGQNTQNEVVEKIEARLHALQAEHPPQALFTPRAADFRNTISAVANTLKEQLSNHNISLTDEQIYEMAGAISEKTQPRLERGFVSRITATTPTSGHSC